MQAEIPEASQRECGTLGRNSGELGYLRGLRGKRRALWDMTQVHGEDWLMGAEGQEKNSAKPGPPAGRGSRKMLTTGHTQDTGLGGASPQAAAPGCSCTLLAAGW